MDKRKPKIVIAPEGCRGYLTAGVSYKVLNYFNNHFFIRDNDGLKIGCVLTFDVHLNGKDWIIKQYEDEN